MISFKLRDDRLSRTTMGGKILGGQVSAARQKACR